MGKFSNDNACMSLREHKANRGIRVVLEAEDSPIDYARTTTRFGMHDLITPFVFFCRLSGTVSHSVVDKADVGVVGLQISPIECGGRYR